MNASKTLSVLTAMLCIAAVAAVLLWLPEGGRAVAGGGPPAKPAVKRFEYVGSKNCRTCHDAEHKSWEKTKMAKCFDLLAPGAGKETRVKVGLDPDKDYRADATCLPCHSAGFGQPGGYAVPDPSDKKAVKEAKNREGVGCESCHGPGSEYVKLFKEIADSGRKYKVEELYAAGLTKVDENVCAACHNEKSTAAPLGHKFDYEKGRDEDTHKRVPLEQLAPS